jgi:8-oxo-dGTP pyrophosphatase MutT (NUDIX family)
MAQKYKVFLENNYVLFTDQDHQLPHWVGLPPISYKLLSKALESESCVQVIAHDPKVAMQHFFAAFKQVRTAGALVQKRNEDAYLWMHRFGHLDLPKGKIEKGETALAAAIREVKEETGLSGLLTFEGILGRTYHVYEMKGKSYWKENHLSAFQYEGQDSVVPQTEEGIEAVFWLQKKDWYARLNESYASLKALLEGTC